jgi:hypothetical protein
MIPDLTTLLAEPRRVTEVPLEAIPGLLHLVRAERGRIDTERARVDALADALVAQLAASSDGQHDRLLTVDQAATRLGTTEDWLRRRRAALPFVVRLSEGQVRYSAKGIERFIAARMGGRAAAVDLKHRNV